MLSQTKGQVNHVLLTRASLYSIRRSFAFDLHVLGAPPTFALSQDQTLQLNWKLILKNRTFGYAPKLMLRRPKENRLENPMILPSVCYSVVRDRELSQRPGVLAV